MSPVAPNSEGSSSLSPEEHVTVEGDSYGINCSMPSPVNSENVGNSPLHKNFHMNLIYETFLLNSSFVFFPYFLQDKNGFASEVPGSESVRHGNNFISSQIDL